MKLLVCLILIIGFISNCYSQSSSSASASSSSSSEQCSQYCSGPSCSVCVPHIYGYNPANPSGGFVYFLGDFGSDTTGLSILIGNQTCSINWITSGRVDCKIGPLNQFEFYDVQVSNANGVIILHQNFYSPYIYCEHGSFSMGHCYCTEGYTGLICDTELPPYITSITSSSVDGGLVTANGWFGSNGQSYSYFIGDKKIRVSMAQLSTLIGYAPAGTGTKDIKIYDGSNNQLVFTGLNLFSYDSNKCFNDCFNNGECNNGVCACDYPWVGDFCSHTKDSSCQCTYI